MNAVLKRMFEDDDRSIEEAKLRAAIFGKSYEECKKDWELQFKKEFVLAHWDLINTYDLIADKNRKIYFTLRVFEYNEYNQKLFGCNGVELKREDYRVGLSRYHRYYITVSFYDFELDEVFMKKFREKMRKYTEL